MLLEACGTSSLLYLQMYSFTSFAMQLNELRKEMEGVIAPTDCRLRPDIRAMENGDIGKRPIIERGACFCCSK